MRVTQDLSTARWRKSSYSGGQEGAECIEISDDLPGTIPVRDSKNPTGPVVLLTSAAWHPFITGVTNGTL
ncbi:DUF397 domain-containing protein [Streptomyces sp. NPDC047028]|uniref:DUF397 domain-containing protein n=1 Tax=Streptomyces sp. NPDC047028 TaxID=3155793 RepID=UPI0033D8501E